MPPSKGPRRSPGSESAVSGSAVSGSSVSDSSVSDSGGGTAEKLAVLREELRRIERSGWSGKSARTIPLGLSEVDRLLCDEARPGLRMGCLHEFAGEGAEAFAAILSGRLKGPVLWCADALAGSELYPPGLAAFGLDYRRLILVRCRKPREILAAMEDGLRCRALAAVVGELSAAVDLTASRRLQLAAENSGVTGFIVQSAWRDQAVKSRPGGRQKAQMPKAPNPKVLQPQPLNGKAAGRPCQTAAAMRFSGEQQVKAPSAAFSRWTVGAARNTAGNTAGDAAGNVAGNKDDAAGRMTWRLSLHRCRNGGSGAWTVKWDAKAYRFSLAAEIADGQADPPPEQSSGQRLVG